MGDVIILEKASKKKDLLESIVDKTAPTEVTWVSSFINFVERYKNAMNNLDLDEDNGLRLIGIKKYWKQAGQV